MRINSLRAPHIKQGAYFLLFPTVVSLSLSISAFEIFSSLIILISLGLFFNEAQRASYKDRWVFFFLFYLVAYAFSWAYSDYFYESFRGFFRVLRHSLFCLSTVYLIDTKSKFRALIKFVLLWAGVVGLDALVQGLSGFELFCGRKRTPYFFGSVYRVTGPFHHPNDFSAYLSLMVFIFWGVLTEGWAWLSKKERWGACLGFVFILASLIWTFSRGAWVAVAAVFLLWVIIRRSRLGILLLLIISVWGIFLSPHSVRFRAGSLLSSMDGTVGERRLLWNEALSMMREKPWFGHGPNTYARLEPRYKSKDVVTDNQYAHNGYLQIGAETGFIGLFAFLATVFYGLVSSTFLLLRQGRSWVRAAGLALSAGIFAFLIHAATDTDFQSKLLINFFWLAMALLYSAKRIART